METSEKLSIHFSDYFDVSVKALENAGAFNISLISDIPLFIDPFLLFNSDKPKYQELHSQIIKYLRFLQKRAGFVRENRAYLRLWYTFPEVKETWLGFSKTGNQGSGLGLDFARSLSRNLNSIFSNFGQEKITRGSHLEKVCLIGEGVGKDNISDFTTNLIKEHLIEFTQLFAEEHISEDRLKEFSVNRVRFNYQTESWESGKYFLPHFDGDFVLLTPKDVLTREEIWINKSDLIKDFESITIALPNPQLRAQVNNYFRKMLPYDPTSKEKRDAASATIFEFPQVIEYYIRRKEDSGDRAIAISEERVDITKKVFVDIARELANELFNKTGFYEISGNTLSEAKERVQYLKDFIEYKKGYRLFYSDGQLISTEADLQLLFRLTWFGTPSDISQEVDDGRGPADFKISRGALDKTIVEFKLASNTKLKQNLQTQAELYQKASDAQHTLKVIFFFSEKERDRVNGILEELNLRDHPDIILIDARDDNKPSASVAKSVDLD